MSINTGAFAIILLLSLALAASYYLGHKKNMRTLEKISKHLEAGLKPAEKEYTWLGGVLGFTGNFRVKNFQKVTASVFMLPRQSLLYLPFAYITTGYDRLEVMFYLKQKLNNEIHIIRKIKPSYRMPTIHARASLHQETVPFDGKAFLSMSRLRTPAVQKLLAFGRQLEPLGLMHLALTPEKSIFYLRLKIKLSDTERTAVAIRQSLAFLRGFRELDTRISPPGATSSGRR